MRQSDNKLQRLAKERRAKLKASGVEAEPTVEEEEVLEETIERVTCRWCGNSEQIETIPAVTAE